MMRNPFVARGMIKSEKGFWGRESETETLYSLLLDSEEEPQSVAIVGLRKIGKSSLLYRIAEKRGAQPMYADQLDRTVCVMVSMQAMSSLPIEEFFAAITEELIAQDSGVIAKLVVSPSRSAADPSQQLRQILRLMDREGYLLVLLLDEFECAAANPAFDKSFFDLLRSMAQQWQLAFILATQNDLDQLWDKSLISSPHSSPFFNFFQTLTLVGFRDGEVHEYLKTLSHRAGTPFKDLEIGIIKDVGGLHPFFINVAAYHLFQALLTQHSHQLLPDRDALWMWITQDPTLYSNFKYYWQNLTPPRRQVLIQAARGKLSKPFAPDIRVNLDWLGRMGLAKRRDDGYYEPFSKAFREFLLELSQKASESELGLSVKPKVDFVLEGEQRLDDLYQIEEIASDTMHSRVVKATDKNLRRQVAIKSLRLHQKAIDEFTEQHLLREAQILARLWHPNIGRVYHIIPNPLRVVMEWVEGTSLQDILDGDEQLSASDVIKIGIKLADALSHTHEREVIHRDIKPDNIILSKSRGPVLIDFDIARARDHETITLLKDGMSIYRGTIRYSAPEQLSDREMVGPPTDLFALGLVLYELLTRQLPYKLGNAPSLYENSHFPEPERYDIPEPLYHILCKLLREKPDQRPDAATLKEELQDCLNLWDQTAVSHLKMSFI